MKLGIVMRWECLKWKYEYLLNGNTGTPEVCGYFTEIFIILKWRVFLYISEMPIARTFNRGNLIINAMHWQYPKLAHYNLQPLVKVTEWILPQ